MTTQSQKDTSHPKEDKSLKELIFKIQEWGRYLLSKWIIIFAFGLLGGALGFWYATVKKPIYTATSTFVLEEEKSGGGLGNLAGLASMAGVDLGDGGGGIFQGDNILELYKSRKMLQQTLLTTIEVNGRTQTLMERYIQFNKFNKQWVENPKLIKLGFKADSLVEGNGYLKSNRSRDSLVTIIVDDISKNYLNVAKLDKKLNIIKVDVKAKDEVFAKTFNDAIVKNVNNFYLQTKTKKSLKNVQIMQRKTDSVRAVMNGAIYTAVAVADATPNLNPTKQVQRVAPAQKAQFSAETNKAILSYVVQNLEMAKMSLLKEAPLLEVIDRPIYPLNIQKFGKLKGILMGVSVFCFLSILSLLFMKIFKDIVS
ncbi:lipopolysaccharide biosynthesis protein [Pedobacter psychrodurus]|uniref:lipopolysaccharide biosynthesis protein n=1 Tax=Pedobacter psychrodurus TaxID=2530456 RepID=UPI00292DE589|nr:lipopolysaccharide biosynthesis protein [Pedobacter psychrodurus]